MDEVKIALTKAIMIDGRMSNTLPVVNTEVTLDTLIKMDKPVMERDLLTGEVCWRPPSSSEQAKMLIMSMCNLNPVEAGSISPNDLENIMEVLGGFLPSRATKVGL